MKSTVTIGRRVGLGFASLLLLAAITGALAVYEVTTVRHAAVKMKDEFVPEAKLSAELEAHVGVLRLESQGYGLTSEADRLARLHETIEIASGQLQELETLAASHPDLVVLRQRVGSMAQQLEQFMMQAGALEQAIEDLSSGRAGLDDAALQFTHELRQLGSDQYERLDHEVGAGIEAAALRERGRKLRLTQLVEADLGELRVAAAKAQIRRDPALIRQALPRFATVAKHLAELRGLLRVEADIEELQRVTSSAEAYQHHMESVARLTAALNTTGADCDRLGAELLAEAQDIAMTGMDRTSDAAASSEQRLQLTVRGVVIGFAALAVLGILISTRVVSRVRGLLAEISGSLAAGADQMVHASRQISDAATQVASGASQGAAALEETSASMEEISGMVHRTSDSAREAAAMARDARTSADAGTQRARSLNQAMEAIKVSSGEISQIIKTIDEIAFQTNLLALNAAVEAARAGEAGAGFSVVAEEVRALAQRATKAAQESGQKIENAVNNSGLASGFAVELSEELTKIVERVSGLDRLIASISGAAGEQSQGIDQVNRAVSDIDQVTQANASAAEESASAAEELTAEADAVRGLVGVLEQLAGNVRPTKGGPTSPATFRRGTARPVSSKNAPVVVPAGGGDDGDITLFD